MKPIKFILLLVIFGCGPSEAMRYVCTCDQKKMVQDFVRQSIKDANNMSDEEMEDVINELYQVGVRTNCEYKMIQIDGPSFVVVTKLDSCESVMSNAY